MKSTKLIVSTLSVVVCGLFALSIGLEAQTARTLRLSRATPVKDVAKFESQFTDRLNKSISTEATARRNWIAGKKVWKDFVDYFLITIDKRAAKKDLVQLSDAQLRELGDLVKSRFDEAISSKRTSSLGQGQITGDFFRGKLVKK
jgi:hypothetical protein